MNFNVRQFSVEPISPVMGNDLVANTTGVSAYPRRIERDAAMEASGPMAELMSANLSALILADHHLSGMG